MQVAMSGLEGDFKQGWLGLASAGGTLAPEGVAALPPSRPPDGWAGLGWVGRSQAELCGQVAATDQKRFPPPRSAELPPRATSHWSVQALGSQSWVPITALHLAAVEIGAGHFISLTLSVL